MGKPTGFLEYERKNGPVVPPCERVKNFKALSYQQNYIVFEANKLQFASLDKKIQMFKEVVLYGGMTTNEWRAGCNMPPIEDGDKRIMRLDAAPVNSNAENTEDTDKEGDKGNDESKG